MAKKQLAMKVDHVSMRFNLSSEKVDNIKEYVIKMIKKELMFQEFWALRDISFEVKKGDRVGIMGLNGAGKSTLLKIVSGVLKATEGTVTTNGKIAPLLELGAGFDKQYTGAENIFLYGAMLGYSKEFLEEKYDEIVVLGTGGFHQCTGEELFIRYELPSGIFRGYYRRAGYIDFR